ncbi:hypothetical protein CC80DRAFT_490769 [Byssothecium circinans]|uniref:Uncharacterized protein n=1 Tax=Byssothecium circinans TaxID=147558 RepID=A0A6A5U2Y5_9PLEO|nr:hypothetical protein CC80DRAFT_498294 [Byssothecium circinans]KAF1959028.1 hypothetical protein CC80DRAFT_490769 [Byssothecium circinans]
MLALLLRADDVALRVVVSSPNMSRMSKILMTKGLVEALEVRTDVGDEIDRVLDAGRAYIVVLPVTRKLDVRQDGPGHTPVKTPKDTLISTRGFLVLVVTEGGRELERVVDRCIPVDDEPVLFMLEERQEGPGHSPGSRLMDTLASTSGFLVGVALRAGEIRAELTAVEGRVMGEEVGLLALVVRHEGPGQRFGKRSTDMLASTRGLLDDAIAWFVVDTRVELIVDDERVAAFEENLLALDDRQDGPGQRPGRRLIDTLTSRRGFHEGAVA